MSRSYKKTPICGYTKANSDKQGKKMISKRIRMIEKQNIHSCLNHDNFDDFSTTSKEQIPKWTYLAKDGKQFLHDDCLDLETLRKCLKK